MKRHPHILFFICLFMGGFLSAQEALQSNRLESYIPINNVRYLEQQDKTSSIEAILLKEAAFRPIDKQGVSISKKGAVWMTFQISKPLDNIEEYYLTLGDFDEITLFFPLKNGDYRSFKNGKFIIPDERIIDKIPVAFSLQFENLSLDGKIWAKIIHYNSNEIRTIRPEILKKSDFNRLSLKANKPRLQNNIIIGFLGGVLLAFLIYPFTFFFFSKHTYFIFYALYIISNFLLLIYSSERYSNIDILFSYHPTSLINIEPTIFVFSAICYFIFLREFTLSIIESKSINLFLAALFIYESFIWIIDIIFKLVLNDSSLSQRLAEWASIPIFAGVIFVMYKLFALRKKVLFYVAIGIGFVICGLALNVYFFTFPTKVNTGALLDNPYIYYHIGVVIELLFFSIALNQARQDERNEQLTNELILKNQVVDLEKKALQAQMNPHFIFNCLTSIQRLVMDKETDHAMRYLSRFSKLVRGTLDASVLGEVSLEEEVDMLKNYLLLEKLRFKSTFRYEITIDSSLDVFDTIFPPMLLQPYVENAIIHGMQDMDGNGKITINFQNQKNKLVATISDNGGGMTESSKLNSLHKSVGMSITSHRLKLLHDGEDQDFVQITDILDDGDTIGVQVKVVLTELS